MYILYKFPLNTFPIKNAYDPIFSPVPANSRSTDKISEEAKPLRMRKP